MAQMTSVASLCCQLQSCSSCLLPVPTPLAPRCTACGICQGLSTSFPRPLYSAALPCRQLVVAKGACTGFSEARSSCSAWEGWDGRGAVVHLLHAPGSPPCLHGLLLLSGLEGLQHKETESPKFIFPGLPTLSAVLQSLCGQRSWFCGAPKQEGDVVHFVTVLTMFGRTEQNE